MSGCKELFYRIHGIVVLLLPDKLGFSSDPVRLLQQTATSCPIPFSFVLISLSNTNAHNAAPPSFIQIRIRHSSTKGTHAHTEIIGWSFPFCFLIQKSIFLYSISTTTSTSIQKNTGKSKSEMVPGNHVMVMNATAQSDGVYICYFNSVCFLL